MKKEEKARKRKKKKVKERRKKETERVSQSVWLAATHALQRQTLTSKLKHQ